MSRKDNTLLFENEQTRKVVPITGIETIYAFGELDFNAKLINFLSQQNILLHYFNYYGYYSGTFYPRERYVSGDLLVRQVNHYTDKDKRLFIARKIVSNLGLNLSFALQHYYKHGKALKRRLNILKSLTDKVKDQTSIPELMSVEGGMWDVFYRSFEQFLPDDFLMEKREKRPPTNPINALISFGNSMLYTQVLSQMYQTQLNPTVSYLHEPSTQRFSLSLDIAELFKPHIVFRSIFKLINMRTITLDDFDEKTNKCLLNEKGRKKFVIEFDKRLDKTYKHPRLKRKVSNKYCFKLECYKLIKHLLDDKEYEPYLLSERV